MRLSVRTQKSCYSVATLVCLASAITAITYGIRHKDTARETALNERAFESGRTSTNQDAVRVLKREDFATMWDRPLRRPLYDPPPPKPQVHELPPLHVELVGTIIEDANSMALVRTEKGNVEYKRAGDTVGLADNSGKIIEIIADAIIVERASERLTFKVNDKSLR